jgi:hypothetical protein
MPLQNGFFPSDQINILLGFDGSEPKEVKAWNRSHNSTFPTRVVFALNQHYPELQSGFYCNKKLVALIQEALLAIGLHAVIGDNFRPDGIVPEEVPGSLEIYDDYILIDQNIQICGRLNVWESSGGKSQIYHDRFIMEILMNQERCEQLVQVVIEKCKANDVATTRMPKP